MRLKKNALTIKTKFYSFTYTIRNLFQKRKTYINYSRKLAKEQGVSFAIGIAIGVVIMLLVLSLTIFLIEEANKAKASVGNTDLSLIYSTVALVVVTVGLVAVTAYYAIQTRNTVRELKKATEMQFFPSLIATFKSITTDGKLNFVIKNIGRGQAIRVKVKFSVKENPSEIEEEHHIQLLQPTDIDGQSIWFTAGNTTSRNVGWDEFNKYYMDNQRSVIVKLDYKDVLDKDYQKEQLIDITAEIKRSRNKYLT
jgi:hypothetical protein